MRGEIKLHFIFSIFSNFRNNPAILGENNQNIPHIVKIVAEAVACEVFENYPELANRLKVILSQIQVCGIAVFSRIFVKASSAALS